MMRNGAAEVFYMIKVKERLRLLYPEDFLEHNRLVLQIPDFKDLGVSEIQNVKNKLINQKIAAEQAAGTVYNLNILLGLGSGNIIALGLGYANKWINAE